MKRRLHAPLLGALLLLVGLSGCSAVRGQVRSWRNTDMVGQAAPALGEGTWVQPVAPDPARIAPWRLLVFFKPL